MGGGKGGGTEHSNLEVYRTSTFGSFDIKVNLHLEVDRSERPYLIYHNLNNLYRTKTISTVLSLREIDLILVLKEFFFKEKNKFKKGWKN